MHDLVRPLVAVAILALLVRAGRVAWHHRELVLTVWRQVRLRHVVGSLALVALVIGVATTLIGWVPGMDVGLGSLLATDANVVFVPLEEAARLGPPAPPQGPDWQLIGLASVFLLPLAAMLPWLAFVEEEVFRAGLEDASLAREVVVALVFGLAHLVMLVPLGAALAVGVAGFVYGRLYRRAWVRAGAAPPPPVAVRAFRPTRRSAAAAARARSRAATAEGDHHPTTTLLAPAEHRQAAAVLGSTVWHATFNTLIVVLVWASLVGAAASRS